MRRAPISTVSLLLVLGVILATSYPTLAQSSDALLAQTRAGNVLFTVPDGWQRKTEADGTVMLTRPETTTGQWCQIRLLTPRAMKGTPRAQLGEELAGLRKKYNGLEAGQVVAQRHKNGYDIAFTAFSMESGAKAGEYLYCVASVAKVDDQAQVILLMSNNSALYNQSRKTGDEFINGMGFANLQVLADGKPPLTQGTVNDVTDFVEWLLEVPLTDGQQEAIRQHLIDSWKKGDKEEMTGAAEVLKVRSQLSEMTPGQREVARQAAQPEAVKVWREQPDAMAKMVVGIFDAGHKPIAVGNPPLTRQAADAAIELFYFMACKVGGGEADVQPTENVKDTWAKTVAQTYPTMTAEAKKSFAQMPMTWAALRCAWPDLPAAERAKLGESWAQIPQIKELSVSLAKIRAEVAASNAEKRAETWRQMQEHQSNMQAISNMSMMMHQTNMAIISNMNSGWHYEYRYR